MNIKEGIEKRFSVRAFTDEVPSMDTIKEITKHPDNEIVWCGVAIGYADYDDPINNYRTRREELDSFVKFIK